MYTYDYMSEPSLKKVSVEFKGIQFMKYSEFSYKTLL